MQDWALLIKSAAWPAVTLIVVLWFREQLIDLLTAFSTQIETAKSIKGRAFGVSLELANEVAKKYIQDVPKSDGPATESEAAEFERKVAEYESVNDPDPRARAQKRHPIADRLGTLAVSLRLKRLELASGSEGRLVALATAIVLERMRGDLAAIEKAAAAVKFKYTAYRLVLALLAVMPSVAPSNANLKRLDAILAAIATNAGAADDPSLNGLIERAKKQIDSFRSDSER